MSLKNVLVLSLFLSQAFEYFVLPRLVAGFHRFVEGTPAGSLVDNSHLVYEGSQTFHQNVLEGDAALLAQSAVELSGTFG